MKTSTTVALTVAATLGLAGPAVWFTARSARGVSPVITTTSSDSAPLFYQSAMHPWIRSDRPGRCTLCGMELTPIYAGQPGGTTNDVNVVSLTEASRRILNVQTAEVTLRPLSKSLRVAGVLEDDATRHRYFSAYIPGRIDRLHPSYVGAEIEAGQPLAEFYSPQLLQAEREYRSLTGDLRVAAALRLRQMGLSTEQIAALPDKPADQLTSPILAPMTGTVVVQNGFAGQYVQAGEKLFELADLSTLWFQFRAYEADLPWLTLGLRVDVTTPARPGEIITSQIAFIDPSLDDATRSTLVRVEVPNPRVDGRRRLQHRSSAEGIVRLAAPEVLTVPRAAVLTAGPESVVFIDQGQGAYVRRTVQIGRRGDTDVEVRQGLLAGERVVTQGNLLLDGQAELNRSFEPAADRFEITNAPTGRLAALSSEQRRAAESVLDLAAELAAALSADDLGAFRLQAGRAVSLVVAFQTALGETNAGIKK